MQTLALAASEPTVAHTPRSTQLLYPGPRAARSTVRNGWGAQGARHAPDVLTLPGVEPPWLEGKVKPINNQAFWPCSTAPALHVPT